MKSVASRWAEKLTGTSAASAVKVRSDEEWCFRLLSGRFVHSQAVRAAHGRYAGCSCVSVGYNEVHLLGAQPQSQSARPLFEKARSKSQLTRWHLHGPVMRDGHRSPSDPQGWRSLCALRFQLSESAPCWDATGNKA